MTEPAIFFSDVNQRQSVFNRRVFVGELRGATVATGSPAASKSTPTAIGAKQGNGAGAYHATSPN